MRSLRGRLRRDGHRRGGAAVRDPVFGTMAHSFVQAHDDEAQAFTHFAESFPANAMLPIDTYDTVEGARCVAEIAPRLAERGIRIKGVRLDSGDLDALSRAVRRVLNEAGLHDAVIFASGNLDEQRVHALVAAGAPITSFGVGTSLTTSSDAPCLDAVYKLQEYAGQALRQNAKRTTSQISKRINILMTTVHNRIKKLEKLGIIKHYTVEVDHAKLGKPISAYIMVAVVYMLPSGIKLSQEDVAKHIKGLAGVESVEIMTGETDLLVKIRVKDIAELNDFVIRKLRKVEGVDKTRTMIVLSKV